MIPGATCSVCAYFAPPRFNPDDDRTFGQCRRYAPIIDPHLERLRTVWPMVSNDAWCGEHATVGVDAPDEGLDASR